VISLYGRTCVKRKPIRNGDAWAEAGSGGGFSCPEEQASTILKAARTILV
jgi:hypothetical protein